LRQAAVNPRPGQVISGCACKQGGIAGGGRGIDTEVAFAKHAGDVRLSRDQRQDRAIARRQSLIEPARCVIVTPTGHPRHRSAISARQWRCRLVLQRPVCADRFLP
jgi:hypothetical protein